MNMWSSFLRKDAFYEGRILFAVTSWHNDNQGFCCCLTGIDGPAAFQDDVQKTGSQVQILTIGQSSHDDDDGEKMATGQQQQSKQDLRTAMQKKGK